VMSSRPDGSDPRKTTRLPRCGPDSRIRIVPCRAREQRTAAGQPVSRCQSTPRASRAQHLSRACRASKPQPPPSPLAPARRRAPWLTGHGRAIECKLRAIARLRGDWWIAHRREPRLELGGVTVRLGGLHRARLVLRSVEAASGRRVRRCGLGLGRSGRPLASIGSLDLVRALLLVDGRAREAGHAWRERRVDPLGSGRCRRLLPLILLALTLLRRHRAGSRSGAAAQAQARCVQSRASKIVRDHYCDSALLSELFFIK
jgi:hypothetical protein